jgi:soluble lytic murein transglycosylase-like protein
MSKRHRSRDGFALAATPLVVLLGFAAAGAEAPDQVAERLRDLSARVAKRDPAAEADLLSLRANEGARSVSDVVAHLAARSRAQSDKTAGAAGLENVIAAYPASPIATRAAADLAEILSERGASPPANGGADARLRALVASYAVDDPPLPLDVARLLSSTGSYFASSDPQTAAGFLTRARKVAPGSQAARRAAAKLRELRSRHPELAPANADALFEEARLAAREETPEDQRRWLERFLERYPRDGRRRDALLQIGQSIVRTTGRPAAADWLERRAKAETSRTDRVALLYAAATHRWNANEDALALARFEELVALGIGGADEQRAYYSIGRIHEAAGRLDAAGIAYRRSRSGADATVATESRWRTGWVAYLASDFGAAAKAFEEAVRVSRGEQSRDAHDAALYWQARSLEKNGDAVPAGDAYRALLADSPDSFYAYLAEKRVGLAARLPEPAPLPAPAAENEKDRERLTRIEILNLAGFADLAAIDIAGLLEARSVDGKRALLPPLADAGAHSAALRTALELRRRGALTEAQLYAYLYPTAFASIVKREAGASALDPFLVYALMKQESLFDPHAVSPASAVGLMQLLPSTANRLLRIDGAEEVVAEALFDPNLNVRLGVAYLAELAVRFHNDPVFILASYNAGEKAADGWKQRFGAFDLDELVERITYRETRQYVKKVLGNYRNYLRLYAGLRPVVRGEQAE